MAQFIQEVLILLVVLSLEDGGWLREFYCYIDGAELATLLEECLIPSLYEFL